MKSLRIAFALVLMAAFSQNAQAQDYKSAVGLRLGYPWAASYKTFINESSAIEVFAGYRGYTGINWFSLNGAYLIHKDISSTDGLQWYFGGGAGVQFWNSDFFDTGATTFSVAGYLGLQYTLSDTPLSLTLDWSPTFFVGDGFGGFSGFGASYGGLGVRYVLNR